ALGGIPESVENGVNGLLFRGNDPADLARCLASVIEQPETLARLREGVRPPKDIAAHAAELEAVYAGRDLAPRGAPPRHRRAAAAPAPPEPVAQPSPL